jgi:dipeptidyl aminopeptidase/acylaminoacyl peptidase
MGNSSTPARQPFHSRFARLGFHGALVFLCVSLARADPQQVTEANYKQAAKYSATYLRQFVYDTSVNPNWIGKTDSFWYQYHTSKGTNYYRVDAKQATKQPLFDRVKLGTLLSEMVQKPLDATQLPLSRLTINSEGTKITFVVEEMQYEYDLQGEKLAKLGKAPPAPRGFAGPGGRGEFRRRFDDQQRRDDQQQEQRQDQQQRNDQQQQQQDQQRQTQQRLGQRGFPPGLARRSPDGRVYSPDRKAYVFVRNHNLYLVDTTAKPLDNLLLPVGPADFAGVLGQLWKVTNGLTWLREAKATQLSTDGVQDYSFGSMATFGAGMDDAIGPPQVEWSRDSKAFYATRIDTRGVQELFLVNSLATPRPKLEKYKYPMPGEEAARKMELFVCDRATQKLLRVKPKWKDEAYSNMHWGKTSDELRFFRRDRLWRHSEFCTANVRTGETKCLILEGFENANVTFQPAHYLDDTDEMIWWSERSGWGHFYLYDRNGKLKNAITTGLYRAGRIVAVDPKNRVLYFQANGREPAENVYYQHLYSVHLDGTGLTLLDPGDANHQSVLSPSRQFVVDNCSRVDMAPVAVLRDATGRQVMRLEDADLSRLYETGWKMPERFVVKAADGVTDLYGNLWKPFDFDPKKKYPIIVHCYPGPQQEGVTHTFSAISSNQQLAQLGFIVIQVGHRGGAPTRSKAYASYGYFNLRDYGLADKKAAVEQLAARCPFIDVERVGIYGHSGGGFMSAAAVLQKPFNEFFKAAVASAGNHDNNIYNNGWAERYHGLREVAATKDDAKTKDNQVGASDASRRGGGTRTRQGQSSQGGDDEQGGMQDEAQQEQGQVKDEKKQDKTKGEADAKSPQETRFEIKVPTNAELAANLKGHLLLVHGEIDNNVHPANTMRLVDALIKANKRFDMFILPGKRHGFGDYQPYFTQRMWDFFAEHLLGDRQTNVDIFDKDKKR